MHGYDCVCVDTLSAMLTQSSLGRRADRREMMAVDLKRGGG